MRRILVLVLSVFVVLAAGAAFYAWRLTQDEAFLKTRLSALVLKHSGRELAIDGPVLLDLGRVVTFEARGLRLQNAPWAEPADMLTVGRLRVALALPSLFGERLLLPELELEDVVAALASNADGARNWELVADPEPDAAATESDKPFPALPNVRLRNIALSHIAPDRKFPLAVHIDDLALDLERETRWQVSAHGAWNDEAMALTGWMEPAGAFATGGPLEHEIELTAGPVSLASRGRMSDARTGAGADLQMRFRGPEIANVLADFHLPPVSTGAFDFRLNAQNQGEFTHLQVEGDLGNLDATARGTIDRLLQPARADLQAEVTGPDLQALGDALGLQGLVPGSFSLQADATLQGTALSLKAFELETPQDHLATSGTLELVEGLAGSRLDVTLQTAEVGRLAPLWRRPPFVLGETRLQGWIGSDKDGVFRFDASARHGEDSLHGAGSLGALGSPFHPDIQIEYASPDGQALRAALPLDALPAAPIELAGGIARTGQGVAFRQVTVNLAGNRGVIDGQLAPRGHRAGSAFEIQLDSPDLAQLGSLLGTDGLPSQPVKLSATLTPEGKGLAFKTSGANVGDIRLDVDGRLPDASQPLRLDADFDVQLPSAQLLGMLLPDLSLPDLPFSAAGALRNGTDHTELQGVRLSLGDFAGSIAGRWYRDQRFDLQFEAQGPDASGLQALLGQPLPALPFSLSAGLSGDPRSIGLKSAIVSLGSSAATGTLQFQRGDPGLISGAIDFARLDLTEWLAPSGPEASPAPPSQPGGFVFGDRPVDGLDYAGPQTELQLSAKSVAFENARFEDVALQLRLDSRQLKIEPFKFRGAGGGETTGRLLFEHDAKPPRLQLSLRGKGLKMGLAAGKGQEIDTLPPTDLELDLRSHGFTQREVASNLNGRLRGYSGAGLVASSGMMLLFSDFLSTLFKDLNPFAEKSDYTRFECSTLAADIVDGRVEATPLVFLTEQLMIVAAGTIDLHTEKLDLSFRTTARKGIGISAGVLINPFLKVGGTLANPAIEIDPTAAVIKSGAALITGGLSLLAGSVQSRINSSADPCGEARKLIDKRDR